MKQRPTSVTVIAWFLVVMGWPGLLMTAKGINDPVVLELMSKSPLSIPVQCAMSFGGSLVMIVSGIFMLKGRDWARTLYVAWSAVVGLIGLVTSPMKAAMIPGIVMLLIEAFFLFRPKANEYFSRSWAPQHA